MAREHRSLAAIIREHSGGTARAEPADCLSMRTHVPSRLSGGDGGFGALPTLTFKVGVEGAGVWAGVWGMTKDGRRVGRR
eukprot:201321-Chlamydomonas_euryale.AAC.2